MSIHLSVFWLKAQWYQTLNLLLLRFPCWSGLYPLKLGARLIPFIPVTFTSHCLTALRKVWNTISNTFWNPSVSLFDCPLSLISPSPFLWKFLGMSYSMHLLHCFFTSTENGPCPKTIPYAHFMDDDCFLVLSPGALCQFGLWFLLSGASVWARRTHSTRKLKKEPAAQEPANRRNQRDLARDPSGPMEGEVPWDISHPWKYVGTLPSISPVSKLQCLDLLLRYTLWALHFNLKFSDSILWTKIQNAQLDKYGSDRMCCSS